MCQDGCVSCKEFMVEFGAWVPDADSRRFGLGSSLRTQATCQLALPFENPNLLNPEPQALNPEPKMCTDAT